MAAQFAGRSARDFPTHEEAPGRAAQTTRPWPTFTTPGEAAQGPQLTRRAGDVPESEAAAGLRLEATVERGSESPGRDHPAAVERALALAQPWRVAKCLTVVMREFDPSGLTPVGPRLGSRTPNFGSDTTPFCPGSSPRRGYSTCMAGSRASASLTTTPRRRLTARTKICPRTHRSPSDTASMPAARSSTGSLRTSSCHDLGESRTRPAATPGVTPASATGPSRGQARFLRRADACARRCS